MKVTRLPRSVARELKYYVYLYVHPETDKVIYVGKGKGNRALSHLHGSHNRQHAKVLSGLRRKRLEPRIEILVHGLKDETTAHAVEAAAIDLLGLDQLTNDVRGRQSRRRGRMLLESVVALYAKKPVTIVEPAILIRINQLYRHGMTETELYDATRSAWVVGPRRERAQFAFAIYQGIVREIYQITAWLRGGTTFNTRWPQGKRRSHRKEFVGVIASDEIRRKYVTRSVSDQLPEGSQNPIFYVNC